jgi:hypothetical protein
MLVSVNEVMDPTSEEHGGCFSQLSNSSIASDVPVSFVLQSEANGFCHLTYDPTHELRGILRCGRF